MEHFEKTARNRVKRLPEPARRMTAKQFIYNLDEALICHVGIANENEPFVIPTIHPCRGGYAAGCTAQRQPFAAIYEAGIRFVWRDAVGRAGSRARDFPIR